MNSSLRRRTGLLRLIVLLTVATVALGGMSLTRLVYPPLPDPETATSEELLRWLATGDLRQVSDHHRSVLAVRLERAYRGEFDPAALQEQIAPEYYDRVLANLPILFRTWLFDRADAYAAASSSEKAPLIKDALAAVEAWSGVEIWTTEEAAAKKSTQVAFLEQVEIWRTEADPDRRARLDAFLCDLQAARLMKAFLGN